MRIVAGRHRGRRLAAPEGLAVRPTGDRTREALFNILEQGRLAQSHGVGGSLQDSRVLDAFAGTGALGLEALSRGARHVTFMESQAAALAMIERNILTLEEEDQGEILRCDVLRPPRAPAATNFVLMDPPYGQGLAEPALDALKTAGWIGPKTLVVVELMAREPFALPTGFQLLDERKYGKARLAFLRSG